MSKMRFGLLTDEQWELIEPLLPEQKLRKDNRGGTWATNRSCHGFARFRSLFTQAGRRISGAIAPSRLKP
jgi:transposase